MDQEERPRGRALRPLVFGACGVPSCGVVFFSGYKLAQATPRLSSWAEDTLLLGILGVFVIILLAGLYAILFRGGIERATEVRGVAGRVTSSSFLAIRPKEARSTAPFSAAVEQLSLWPEEGLSESDVTGLVAGTARHEVASLAGRVQAANN